MTGQGRDTQNPESEWRKTTLGAVADFYSGGTPSKSRPDYWSGSIPWVSAKDMKRLRLHETVDKLTTVGVANGTRKVPENTVLILVRGMTLLNDVPVCVTQRPMTFNQDVKAMRPKPSVAEEFLPYLVLGSKGRLVGLVDLAGHGTGRLNTNDIKALEIDLPPLSEQRTIAHILGTLDDKIELNRRMNQTLEEMARALFKSWFVDFDPVRAKAGDRRHSSDSVRDSVVSKTDLFPGRFVHSELGEIPEGWRIANIESICESISSGGTPARKNRTFWDCGTIPWYKTGELMDRPLLNSQECITPVAIERSSAKLWPSGTILFALYASPTVGRIGVLTRPGASNQAAAGLIAKPEYGAPFLRRALISVREQLQSIAVGAAQQNISQTVLRKHNLVVPDPSLARRYSDLVTPIDEQQTLLIRQTQSLTDMRDLLLVQLMTGRITVNQSQMATAET